MFFLLFTDLVPLFSIFLHIRNSKMNIVWSRVHKIHKFGFWIQFELKVAPFETTTSTRKKKSKSKAFQWIGVAYKKKKKKKKRPWMFFIMMRSYSIHNHMKNWCKYAFIRTLIHLCLPHKHSVFIVLLISIFPHSF